MQGRGADAGDLERRAHRAGDLVLHVKQAAQPAPEDGRQHALGSAQLVVCAAKAPQEPVGDGDPVLALGLEEVEEFVEVIAVFLGEGDVLQRGLAAAYE